MKWRAAIRIDEDGTFTDDEFFYHEEHPGWDSVGRDMERAGDTGDYSAFGGRWYYVEWDDETH